MWLLHRSSVHVHIRYKVFPWQASSYPWTRKRGKRRTQQSWGFEVRTQKTLFWGPVTEYRSERPWTNRARTEQSEGEEHQGQAKRWKLRCRAQLQVLNLNNALAPLLSAGMTSTKCTCDTRARLYDHKPRKTVFFQVCFTPAECFNTKYF